MAQLTSTRFAANVRLQSAANNAPPMRRGQRGEAVAILQQALIDRGFPMPISTRRTGRPDGIYGMEVHAAVRGFQTKHRLSPDGIVGRQTLTTLDGLFQTIPPASPPSTPQPITTLPIRIVNPNPQGWLAGEVARSILSAPDEPGEDWCSSYSAIPCRNPNYDPGVGGANWRLQLVLPLVLRQMEPADARVITDDSNPPRTFPVRHWGDGEWNRLVQRFVREVTSFWNLRFWLEPPPDYTGLDWPRELPTHRPRVWCEFGLQFGQLGNLNIPEVRVWKVDLSRNSHFRSNSGRIISNDVFEYKAKTACHEVGHLLGLNHPGVYSRHPQCGTNPNADICYGRRGSRDGNNIMGRGLNVDLLNSHPWTDRIARHTGTTGHWSPYLWNGQDERAQPQELSQYQQAMWESSGQPSSTIP